MKLKMNKRVVVLVGLMVFSLSSCVTTVRKTKEFSSNMNVIDHLVFDNLVSIDNLVDKGSITATVNVLQEIKNNGTLVTLKSDGLNVVADYKKKEISIKGNNVKFGSFTSISTKGGLGSLGKGGMKGLLAGSISTPYLDAKAFVKGLAEQILIDEAVKLGASAIFMPNYTWMIVNDDTTEEFFMFQEIKGDAKYFYQLTITAKAVDFIQ